MTAVTMDEAEYHQHDALSSTEARKLLPPSCPAKYRWEKDNGQPHKAVFDLGHAAHTLVLGVGAEFVVVEADNWLTKAAKEQKKEAYAAGKTPLLTAELAQVQGMAAALREHPVARALFDPAGGSPEQSIFWTDWESGVECRARLDWLPTLADGMVIPDYKTTASAEPGSVGKSMANFGYHQQGAWYIEAAQTLGVQDVGFVNVYQEKQAPFLVYVAGPDDHALKVGRVLNARAREVFAECAATGSWPGYPSEVEQVSLPGWYPDPT